MEENNEEVQKKPMEIYEKVCATPTIDDIIEIDGEIFLLQSSIRVQPTENPPIVVIPTAVGEI